MMNTHTLRQMIKNEVDKLLREIEIDSKNNDFDNYLWSIHEYIDLVVETTKMKNDIINATGIPRSYMTNSRVTGFSGQAYISPGYVYAPYVPLHYTPVYTASCAADRTGSEKKPSCEETEQLAKTCKSVNTSWTKINNWWSTGG